MIYRSMPLNGGVPEDTKVLFEVLLWGERVSYERPSFRSVPQLGAPLDLELAKIFRLCPFHRVQGEEEPLSNFVVRESLTYEAEDFLTRIGSMARSGFEWTDPMCPQYLLQRQTRQHFAMYSGTAREQRRRATGGPSDASSTSYERIAGLSERERVQEHLRLPRPHRHAPGERPPGESSF